MLKRIDILMVEKKIATSRERAKELIKNGQIFVFEKNVKKPSELVSDEAEIKVIGKTLNYVGRGGLKLEKAINAFTLKLDGKICMDIGASTGGFTDCMLQNNAARVYAVDVGHGQLAEKLSNDNRVINIEGVNIRDFDKSILTEEIDFISIDVSFISLRLVLPKAAEILKTNGEIVALIKPQFETGRIGLGKNGIVNNRIVHNRILTDIIEFTSEFIGVLNIDFSAIMGGDGNIEYLMYCKNGFESVFTDTKTVINNAFNELKGGKC